jgi:hypothetical protein
MCVTGHCVTVYQLCSFSFQVIFQYDLRAGNEFQTARKLPDNSHVRNNR